MIYEMRTYRLKVGKLGEFLALFEREGLPIIGKYAKLIGYWQTEIGELNTVIHIWAYDSLDQRTERRAGLMRDPDWMPKYLAHVLPLIEHQQTRIMLPTKFSPLQ
jgi:NIPSNAP protein